METTKKLRAACLAAAMAAGLQPFLATPHPHPHPKFTDLVLAAWHGDLEEVRRLIEAGADVDEVSPEGVTALISAVQGGQDDVVRELLLAKANPDIRDQESGGTALHWAAGGGHVGIISRLLSANADPNIQRWGNGYTALHLAVMNNNALAASALLSGGAEPDIPDSSNEGYTALHYAVNRFWGVDLNTVWTLLSMGADPNFRTGDGYTAWAFTLEGDDLFEMMLATGATPPSFLGVRLPRRLWTW